MTILTTPERFIEEILAATTPLELGQVVLRIEASNVPPGAVLFLRGAVAIRTRELIRSQESNR